MNYFNPDNIDLRQKKTINDFEKMKRLFKRLYLIAGAKIKERDFIGAETEGGHIITESEVNGDMRKASFEVDEEKENVKIFSDLVEMAWVSTFNVGLFGKDMRAVRTSTYDDSKGIDFVAIKESEDKDSYFGFGVDVSFSAKEIKKKLEGIKMKIKQKRRRIGEPEPKYKYSPLYEVKYFADKNGVYKKLFVPKSIVGMDYKNSEELIDGIAHVDKEKIIHSKSYQRSIIEILWQTKFYYEFAKKNRRSHTAIAYKNFYNNFFDLFKKHEKSFINDKDELLNDRVISVFIEQFNINKEEAFNFKRIDDDDSFVGRDKLKRK